MGLINETASQYYTGVQGYFVTSSGTQTITLTFDPNPVNKFDIRVYVNGSELDPSLYTYDGLTVQTISTVASGSNIEVKCIFSKTGKYQFISIQEIVNNFMIAYVGNGKLIDDVKRSDVIFHAKRGIQEFSYDIARVEKIQEIELGPTLKMPMPQDYVNVVKISWVDTNGFENIIYPYSKTSKPSASILQANDYNYLFDNDGSLLLGDSITNQRFIENESNTLQARSDAAYFLGQNYDTQLETNFGGRFGITPDVANNTGVYVINEAEGVISFSSNLANNIITLKYVSDGLGSDEDTRFINLQKKLYINTSR